MNPNVDPAALSLEELRSERARLHDEDDAVSYVRRVAQTRIDLVCVEIEQRGLVDGERPQLADSLRDVLSSRMSSGGVRPPRDAGDVHNTEYTQRLEAVSVEAGFDKMRDLDVEALKVLRDRLIDFEREVSSDRSDRFERLNDLSAELVRRYRSGEATVGNE